MESNSIPLSKIIPINKNRIVSVSISPLKNFDHGFDFRDTNFVIAKSIKNTSSFYSYFLHFPLSILLIITQKRISFKQRHPFLLIFYTISISYTGCIFTPRISPVDFSTSSIRAAIPDSTFTPSFNGVM